MGAYVNQRLNNFREVATAAAAAGARPLVLAGATSASALRAAEGAVAAGFAEAHLVGAAAAVRERLATLGLSLLQRHAVLHDESSQVEQRAVGLVRELHGAVLLKGELRTDQLLRAVLARESGLRDGLLSDVLLYEHRAGAGSRLVGITDGGINVQPDAEALLRIARNGIAVMQSLGADRPRVALLSASEAVSDAMPSTRLAARVVAALAEDDCDAAGPLALDCVLLEEAARAKGLETAVAGNADLVVVPNIEAGNVLGKAVKYLYGSVTAHVIVGARAPVLIPSRVESAEDKLASIALGALMVSRA
jgi:phosphate butyryltransferase